MPVLDASVFVHLAAAAYVAGYLIRDQLWLRLLLLIGTFFYIAYYWLVSDTPLWDAIIWSAIMAVANIYVMIEMAHDRVGFGIHASQRALYNRFAPMSPGDFRRLMRVAQFHEVDAETVLTRECERPSHLYFVTEGPIEIEKKGMRFTIEPPAFIGEVSLLMGTTASATVRVRPGVRYVSWERDALTTLLGRRPVLRQRFDTLLNVDLARKVEAGTRPA
ncbi:MAG: cyclic nucleotide-binding domain-containing protein [Pseudomonadota bacterium]